MLAQGTTSERYDGSGRWLDIAGQYIAKREVDRIVEAIEQGVLTDFAAIDNRFRVFDLHYDDYARSWAESVYTGMLGHTPTREELTEPLRLAKTHERPCAARPMPTATATARQRCPSATE